MCATLPSFGIWNRTNKLNTLWVHRSASYTVTHRIYEKTFVEASDMWRHFPSINNN